MKITLLAYMALVLSTACGVKKNDDDEISDAQSEVDSDESDKAAGDDEQKDSDQKKPSNENDTKDPVPPSWATGSSSDTIFWLDGDDVKGDGTANPTGEISTWVNKAGDDDAGQSVEALRPSVKSAALNSRDTVEFSADSLDSSLKIDADAYAELTVMLVYKPHIDNAGGVWGEDNGGYDRFMLDVAAHNNCLSIGASCSAVPELFTADAWTVATIQFDEDEANGTEVFVGGSSVSSVTSNHGPEATGTLQIGDIGTGLYPFDGEIAEMFVFRRLLTTQERQEMEAYIKEKWGITDEDS